MIEDTDIQKFKQIYESKFGVTISNTEATRLAHKLIALYKAILLPNVQTSPKKQAQSKSQN